MFIRRRLRSFGAAVFLSVAFASGAAFAVSWNRVATVDSATATATALCYWNSGGAGTLECSPTNPYIAGGFLGIGTTSPANPLDIGTAGGLRIASGTPTNTAYALYNNAGTLTWNGSALMSAPGGGATGYDAIWTSPTTIGTGLIYESGGNVGIGTTSPGYSLDILGSDNTQSGIHVVNTSSTIARFPGVRVENYSGSGAALWGSPTFYLFASAGSQSSPAAISSGYSLGALDFYGQRSTTPPDWNRGASIAASASENFTSFSGGTALLFRTANIGATTDSEKMRITANGAVGIGTTSPANRLDVSGGMAIGAAYVGTNSAPANGAIIQGNVGIGTTTTPTGVTEAVNGPVQVAGTGSEACTAATYGAMRYNAAGGYFELCTP